METSFSLINIPYALSTPKPQIPFVQHGRRSLKLRKVGTQSGGRLQAAGCGAGSGAAEVERKLVEDVMGSIKEWIGVTKCRDYENNGIVELMECLETEAIMGDDQGREPMDYNRRAHIFDESSRLFQAIKENRNSSSSHNDP